MADRPTRTASTLALIHAGRFGRALGRSAVSFFTVMEGICVQFIGARMMRRLPTTIKRRIENVKNAAFGGHMYPIADLGRLEIMKWGGRTRAWRGNEV